MPNEEGPPPSTDEVYDDQDYGDMRMQVDLALAKQSDHVEEERIKQRLSLDQFQDISRGDAEHWMRGQGFAEFQIQIAIALIFDKKSFATFAKELGTSSSWVGLQVNPRSSLRNVIEKIKLCIRKGISLPSTVPQDAVVIRPPPGLSLVQIDSIVAHPAKLPPPNLMHLRRIADRCRMGQIAPAVVLETIRAYPAWLLEPVGRPLLMVLVDLLEADNYGESQRRIPGVVHSGSPQVISKAAYQALQTLTKAKRGGAFNFSDNQLTTILGLYLTRILLLQDAWQKTSQHASLSIKRRLEIITASLPNEFGKMTDQSILNILHGNALNEASHMASRTTGIRSETFLSAYNRRPPLHIPAIES